MVRCANVEDEVCLESLEARTYMDAAPFASVGLAFESRSSGAIDTTLYATEGVLETQTGAATGTTFAAGEFDRFNAGPLLFDTIQQLDSGRYLRHPNRGTQGEPEESNGARFLTRDGFDAGWWLADFAHGEEEVEWIVELPTDAAPADFQGTWHFAALEVGLENDDFSNAFGEVDISATSVDWFLEGGFMPRASSSIISTSASGTMRTDAAEYFYINADRSVMVFADMAEEEQEIYIGVAVREDPTPVEAEIAGDYLLAWAFADGPAAHGPNGEVNYSQRYLRLESDGDYRIWNLDDYDSGHTDDSWVINRGQWYISGGELVLQERGSGDLAWFTVGDNSSTIVGFLLQNTDADDPVLGLATRAFPTGFEPEPRAVFNISGEGPDLIPLVYELGTDNVWEVTDLIWEAGGPDVQAPVVSWVDPKDGHSYAAGLSDQGVILYSEPDRGDWYFRNLSDEAAGEFIVSDLQVMIAPDGMVNLTGLNSAGELVRYYQPSGQGSEPAGGYDWAFINVAAEELRPQGLDTPAFAGPLVSYATSWGGLNVAGLDSDGHIWSVWWAPGQASWTVTDLSAASGAGPLTGGLTVYLTPWNGINLAGLDSAGDLQVTWWVPALAGEWRRNDLTAETGGATLVDGSVTSYVSSWGGLNISGIDADTGEVQVYWWAPERVGIGWTVSSITTALPPDAPPMGYIDIRGVAAPDGSLNIFGYGEDGSFLRYYWEPTFGGDWLALNLSDTAIDR